MNRIRVEVDGYYVNGMLVSEHTAKKAIYQNSRISYTRSVISHPNYKRLWNIVLTTSRPIEALAGR